jgi:hypothetical protein
LIKEISTEFDENDLRTVLENKGFREQAIKSIQEQIDEMIEKNYEKKEWFSIMPVLALVHREFFFKNQRHMDIPNAYTHEEASKIASGIVDRKLLQEEKLMMRNDFKKLVLVYLNTGGNENSSQLENLYLRDKTCNYLDILYPDSRGRCVDKVSILTTFWQEVNQHTEIGVLIEMLSRLDAVIVNEQRDNEKNKVVKIVQEEYNGVKPTEYKISYYDREDNTVYIEKKDKDLCERFFDRIDPFIRNYNPEHYFFPQNFSHYLENLKNKLDGLKDSERQKAWNKILFYNGDELRCSYPVNSDIWKALVHPEILEIFKKYKMGNNKNSKRKSLEPILKRYCGHNEWNDVHLDYEMERILCVNLILKIYEYVDGEKKPTRYMPEFKDDGTIETKIEQYDTYTEEEIRILCNSVCHLSNPYLRLRYMDYIYQERFFRYRESLKQQNLDQKENNVSVQYDIMKIPYIEEQFQIGCSVVWYMIAKIMSKNKYKKVEQYKKEISEYLYKNYSCYLYIKAQDVRNDIWRLKEEVQGFPGNNNHNEHLKIMQQIILDVYGANQNSFTTYLVK